MAYDLEEQEKIEALKAWWDRYGNAAMALVVAVLVVFAGWRAWQWYGAHQASQAMGYYEALGRATGETGPESVARIEAASQALRTDYARSGYAPRGVLVAAAALQRRGELDAAQAQLEWLVADGRAPALQAVGRLRLAGLLLTQKQYDAALEQLKDPVPAEFEGLFADRRGDILAAQGHADQAREAWQAALKALANDPIGQIVQLKLDALGGVSS